MKSFYSERDRKWGSKKGTEEVYRNIMFDSKIYYKTRKRKPKPKGNLFFFLKFFNESRR